MINFVVGTMGKVGTTALQRSLKRAPTVNAYKTHSLTVRSLRQLVESKAKQTGKRPKWAIEAEQFLESRGLRGDDIVLVTPVREIVGRNISGFFQRLREFGIKPPYEDVDVNVALGKFRNEFNHKRPDNWFRDEYEPVLKIKLDDLGFDPEKGYLIGSINGVNVLLLQIELGDAAIQELFSRQFGVRLKLRRHNDSSRKPYAQLNAAFKEQFYLDETFQEQLMTTRYMRAFYSKEQRDHIAAYYQRKIPKLLPLPR